MTKEIIGPRIIRVLLVSMFGSGRLAAAFTFRSGNTLIRRIPSYVSNPSGRLWYGKRGLSEEDVWHAMERLEALDAKLGVGEGAVKERSKWNAIIQEWEESMGESSDEDECDQDEHDADDINNDDECLLHWDSSQFVQKHAPDDAVAIFGGDPRRRKESTEKKLAPFRLLDQFGTPRDVGSADTGRLLRKIASGRYDVVYVW
eukprot:CAMPEP_0176078078 /NCGR_PEP_ID=MMETSP0120_2-20121206/39045_1 /TAXON_ID=160619 /ORGANISM="Kryptoperidinium foliaceum, Strain CCMP 1326" /LENGTH=201 /DNA_ID=CAMNT_0017411823 /DNA_START=187 /DNA_END=789 /DNA_ORIENTATION=+